MADTAVGPTATVGQSAGRGVRNEESNAVEKQISDGEVNGKKSDSIVDKAAGLAACDLAESTPKKASTKESQAAIDNIQGGNGGEVQQASLPAGKDGVKKKSRRKASGGTVTRSSSRQYRGTGEKNRL